MRLFFAIPVSGSEILTSLYDDLTSLGKGIKAVRPENMHLTLKFLGDPGCSEEAVIEAVGDLGKDIPPFIIRPEDHGAFPNWNRPSVLWIGFDEVETLDPIASELDRRLNEGIGSPLENRGFKAHLTVARIKGRTDTERARKLLESCIERMKRTEYSLDVKGIHLLSSNLTPQGPIYNEVTFHPFGKE